MPDSVIPLNPTRTGTARSRTAFVYAGAAVSILLLASALDARRTFTILETCQCAAVFAAMALAAILFRGPAQMAARPAGRIASTGLFIATMLTLNPVFRYTSFDSNLSISGVLTQRVVVLPCAAACLL